VVFLEKECRGGALAGLKVVAAETLPGPSWRKRPINLKLSLGRRVARSAFGNRAGRLISRHPVAEGDATMKLWGKSTNVWLGAAVVVTGLLLAAPPAWALGHNENLAMDAQEKEEKADKEEKVPTPEPATLTLIALGGGALALARRRMKSRSK
jgi:hypothetical protein